MYLYFFLGGGYQGENAELLGQIQNGVLSLEAWLFFIPNRIKTYLCRTKNGKVICYRILDRREMGVWVLKVTITWTVRARRPKHREYGVSLSLRQIGSNSYHEVSLRSLWLWTGTKFKVFIFCKAWNDCWQPSIKQKKGKRREGGEVEATTAYMPHQSHLPPHACQWQDN